VRPRYLLLIPFGAEPVEQGERLGRRTGLRVAWTAPRLAVLVNDSCGCLEVPDFGVVVGTLFHRHGPARAIPALSTGAIGAIARGGLTHLLRAFWGGYVAASCQGDAVEVMRDPSGALPCYRGTSADGTLLASDVDLLLAAGAEVPGIDWDGLMRMLWSSGLPTRATALAGVSTVLPGTSVTPGTREDRATLRWSPWDHVVPDRLAEEERSARLRRIVQHCVTGWASSWSRPLVSLSGGLDSSIVAACLADAGSDARCVTLYTDDPAGDERHYAQALCKGLGLPLAESRYALDAEDLAKPLGLHLPRPAGRAQNHAYERAHIAVAALEGADVFFTGNGGDNVFGYSQSAAALVDRLRHEGLGSGTLGTLRDVCAQTGAGPWRVLRAAFRIARQPVTYRWKPNVALLAPDLVAAARADTLDHVWLDAPADALPGKAGHVAGLARAQLNIEPDRSLVAPVVNPLLSQPILETCLAIPSWAWRSGGRDRAAARDAFAARLPPSIAGRRSKGTPDPFLGEIVRRNRGALRDRLLGGALAARGLLDRVAIEQLLSADRRTTGEENMRLLELANVEGWLNVWESRLAARRHPPAASCAAPPSG